MAAPTPGSLRLLGLAFLLASAGCIHAIAMRAPGQPLPVQRMAVMASMVHIYEAGVSRDERKADWSERGRLNVDQALRVWSGASGARFFDARDMEDIPLPYGDYRRWSLDSMIEIANRLDGRGAGDRKSVTDWRFPRSLGSWQLRLEADYVLSVLFLDATMSGGMAALAVLGALGGGSVQINQLAMACLVRLSDGQVVWCDRLSSFGDIRAPSSAQSALRRLVQPVLHTDRVVPPLPPRPRPATPPPAPAGVSAP